MPTFVLSMFYVMSSDIDDHVVVGIGVDSDVDAGSQVARD